MTFTRTNEELEEEVKFYIESGIRWMDRANDALKLITKLTDDVRVLEKMLEDQRESTARTAERAVHNRTPGGAVEITHDTAPASLRLYEAFVEAWREWFNLENPGDESDTIFSGKHWRAVESALAALPPREGPDPVLSGTYVAPDAKSLTPCDDCPKRSRACTVEPSECIRQEPPPDPATPGNAPSQPPAQRTCGTCHWLSPDRFICGNGRSRLHMQSRPGNADPCDHWQPLPAPAAKPDAEAVGWTAPENIEAANRDPETGRFFWGKQHPAGKITVALYTRPSPLPAEVQRIVGYVQREIIDGQWGVCRLNTIAKEPISVDEDVAIDQPVFAGPSAARNNGGGGS